MPDLWIPGAADPSLDDFVSKILRQIARFTDEHGADETHVEIELTEGPTFALRSISPDPGYGFLTLTVHPGDDDEPEQLIVPVGSIRRITLGPAENERAALGFSLPPGQP